MSNLKTFIVDDASLEILKKGQIEGKIYFLPQIELERNKYEVVNKVLVALGAKWDKKVKGHVFDYDITAELENVFKTHVVTDWKKSTDFFHTPDAVVNEMLGLLPIATFEEFEFLEPSAGQGHILDLVQENFPNAKINCVEINPNHCERLREKGYSPIQADFMKIEAAPKYDIIMMNPPFTYEMEHIRHAYDFLVEGGILITISSATIVNKNTKKGKEFKAWYDEVGGYDYILPQNSFKESGTGVNTKMLVFNKEEAL